MTMTPIVYSMMMPSYAWGQDDRHAIAFKLHLIYEFTGQ
jgi:hypothetical protein